MYIYSESMEMQHLYILYLSNIYLLFNILISPENYILHIYQKIILSIDRLSICIV